METLEDTTVPDLRRCPLRQPGISTMPGFYSTIIDRLLRIDNPQLELIAVADEFGCIHAFDRRRQCGDFAGGFGAEAVVDAVLAAGEVGEEETDSIVAEFAIGGQSFEHIAAALVVGFEAAGFVVFE